MSGSEDEFGGLSPTTPVAPVKRGNLARTTKSDIRAEPGPSKQKVVRRHAAKTPPSDNSDIEEVMPKSKYPPTNQDGIPSVQPSRVSRKPPSEAPTINGKQTTKGKGKAKAAQSRTLHEYVPEPTNIDPIEILDNLPDVQNAAADIAKQINAAGKRQKKNPAPIRASKNEDVAEQLHKAEATIAALSKQLEEVFHIRETEAEELLKRQEAQYEAQLQAQELLIKELTSQLALKEPLMRSGNSSVLQLLTREAADEEKNTIEKELTWWKNVAEEKQKTIDRNEARVAELEQTEKELRVELKAEIERSSSLVAKHSKNAASVPRGRPGGIDDPRHTEVLRFYEDLTDLLVPNMKVSPGKYLDLEDWILSCIYTHDDETSSNIKKSLNFTLRLCHDSADSSHPIISKDQLVAVINYTPLELDKESPEFVEKLGFLGTPFTFDRKQLSLFLRTIHQKMSDAMGEDEDEGSVQLIG